MVTSPPTTHDDGPVTVIDAVSMPTEEAERFLVRWHDSAAAMARCAGFRTAEVHRADGGDGELRLVTITRWDDGTSLRAAQEHEDVQEAIGRLTGDERLRVPHRPAVYQLAERITPDHG